MKKLITLFLIILFSASQAFSQGSWTQKQSMPGYSRCSGIGLATATHGYVVGGYLGGYDHFKDCWEYNPTTNSWLQRSDFPGAKRRWLMGFVLNNNLYVGLGAFMNGPSNYTYYNDFYKFDAATNTWTAIASFPGTNRVSAFCFELNGKGYIGGGLYGLTALSDLWQYDPLTNTWIQKNNITIGARWAAVSFTAKEGAFVGLGYNGSNYLNDLWKYDPSTDSWLQKANFPGTGRWYGSAFSIENFGYMGTGANASSYYKTYWQYDVSANTWLSIPDLTGSVRCEPITFTIADKAYVGTGLTSGTTYTADLWEYTPSWYGVQENGNDGGVSIYPNPTTGIIYLSFSNASIEIPTVSIYDVNGKLIADYQLNNSKIELNNLVNGMYIIKVITKDGSIVKKIFKQ